MRDIFEDGGSPVHNVTLPNGTLPYEIVGSSLVKNVQEYTLQESDIISLVTSTTNIDEVNFATLIYGALPLFPTLNAKVEGYIAQTTSPFDDVSNIGKYTRWSTTSMSLKIAVAKGTYSSLAEARADLSGTKIWYQLAEPITLQTFTNSPTQSTLNE